MFKQKALLTVMALISITIAFGCATAKSLKGPSAHETARKDVFSINRLFEADRKTVFDMWIKPEHFSSWMGPKGAAMYFISVGVKEGGTSQWSMTTADGMTKYGKLHYKVIDPHHHFVYTQNFCDKDGNPAKLPLAKPYPDMLLTTVTFVEEGAEKTGVTVTWEVYGDATEAERQTFNEMKPVMTVGWSESFDKLESLLQLQK